MRCVGLIAAVVVVAVPAPTTATVPIVDGERGSFELGGYVRTLSGIVNYNRLDIADVDPDIDDPFAGQNVGVVRLEWGATIGEHVVLDLHDRIAWNVSSLDSDLLQGGTGLGVGVSGVPERNVDLSTMILDGTGTQMEHDVDRLALRLYLDRADIVLGRQAITWGNSMLFPVADLWTQFSPFELDTTEKRGIDAARVMLSPSFTTAIDFVIADRGDVEDLSGGVRVTTYLDRGDFYALAAKTYDEVVAGVGYTHDFEKLGVRGEVLLPVDYDDAEVDVPRATAGLDWMKGDWVLSVEYHHNGAGAEPDEEYLEHATTDDVLARREVYLMGRDYLGATCMWQATDLLSFSLTSITNLRDPSAVVAPAGTWSVAQDVDLSAGAFVALGEGPEWATFPLAIDSEFGAAPDLYYLQLAAYF